MKKTMLTISGASAYTEALINEARLSGRIQLTVQAQLAPRRSLNQAEAKLINKPADRELAQTEAIEPALGVKTTKQKSQEVKKPDAETQPEPSASGQAEPELEKNTVVSWNPGSFASTKAVMIEAETALGGTVDEAVILFDPAPMGTKRLSELSLGQIEAASTDWITGYAQLLRELGRRFAERKSGLIVVVLLSGDRDPLGAMAIGAIEALASALSAQSGEAYRLFALRDESGQPELLAKYIIKLLDEPPKDSTKLLRHVGRISLFGK